MLSLTSDPQHPLLLEASPSPCELHFFIDEEAEVQRGLATHLGNSARSGRAGIGPPAPPTQSLSLNHSACSFQEGEGSTLDRQGVCAAMPILPVIASTPALEPPPRTPSPLARWLSPAPSRNTRLTTLQQLHRLRRGRGLAAALDGGAENPEDVLDPLSQPGGCPPGLPQARDQRRPLV